MGSMLCLAINDMVWMSGLVSYCATVSAEVAFVLIVSWSMQFLAPIGSVFKHLGIQGSQLLKALNTVRFGGESFCRSEGIFSIKILDVLDERTTLEYSVLSAVANAKGATCCRLAVWCSRW